MAALQQSPEEALVDKVLGAEQPTGRLYRGLITALRDDAETAEGLAAARKILKALAARAPALAEDRHARLWTALCDSISQSAGLLAERPFCLKELRWAVDAGVFVQPIGAAEDQENPALSRAKGKGIEGVGEEDDEEAAAASAALKAFLREPCNRRCADCHCRVRGSQEAWASMNLGVGVCVLSAR